MAGGGTAEGRPEVRIDRSDVGRRVSARRLSEFVDDRPVFRDVIGVLTSWDDAGLTVAPRDGAPVTFPESALVAGKTVPLFPARRAPLPATAPVDLQRIAARGWPAVEQQQLGDWTLRASMASPAGPIPSRRSATRGCRCRRPWRPSGGGTRSAGCPPGSR